MLDSKILDVRFRWDSKIKKLVRWFGVPVTTKPPSGLLSEDTGLLPLENFSPSEISFTAATIAMIRMSVRWKLCICSKKNEISCTITVGINCRDGSNTLVFIRTGRYVTGPYIASAMYCTTSAPPVRIRHDIMVMMMRQQKRQYYRWVWVPPLVCSALIRKLTWLVRWFRCGGWHYDICYCNCKSCCPTSLNSLTSRIHCIWIFESDEF